MRIASLRCVPELSVVTASRLDLERVFTAFGESIAAKQSRSGIPRAYSSGKSQRRAYWTGINRRQGQWKTNKLCRKPQITRPEEPHSKWVFRLMTSFMNVPISAARSIYGFACGSIYDMRPSRSAS